MYGDNRRQPVCEIQIPAIPHPPTEAEARNAALNVLDWMPFPGKGIPGDVRLSEQFILVLKILGIAE